MATMLCLYRGLPGVGKSTASALQCGMHFEADHFFFKNGSYNFVPSLLPQAHAACQKAVDTALIDIARNGGSVGVANTFTKRWEMQPYFDMAAKRGIRVVVLDLFDAGYSDEVLAEANVHGVPVEVIRRMREGYEHDWSAGDPRPPWERK